MQLSASESKQRPICRVWLTHTVLLLSYLLLPISSLGWNKTICLRQTLERRATRPDGSPWRPTGLPLHAGIPGATPGILAETFWKSLHFKAGKERLSQSAFTIYTWGGWNPSRRQVTQKENVHPFTPAGDFTLHTLTTQFNTKQLYLV